MGNSTKTKGQVSGIKKWIYKTKNSADDSIEKYKKIFMARGFS